jgi:D-alanyl-D-alanine carboxypeptidase (penicillin-binding protein 5/6)
MKLRNVFLALFACLLVFCKPALAFETTPDISEAQAAIVVDASGNVLWSKNAEREMGMASVTKVMTAVVALDSGIDLDTVCTVDYVDLGPYSQTAGFVSGDTPTLRELLRVLLVYSGNDAAVYIAQNVAGSVDAFVSLMNEKALELGMTHTHFANPHGLEEDGHYSSVADLAVLGRYALENYPFIASTVRLEYTEAYTDGWLQTFDTTDYLVLNYEGALGIKTGSEKSGYCFLGAARRYGTTLYTCVLGCDSDWGRWEDTMELLDWGYSVRTSRAIASDSWLIDARPYAYDFRFTCAAYPRESVEIGYYNTGQHLAFETSMLRDSVLVEPGQMVGAVGWTQGGKSIGTVLIETQPTLDRLPAFNIFAVPLFVEG